MRRASAPLAGVAVAPELFGRSGQQAEAAVFASRTHVEPAGHASAGQLYERPVVGSTTARRPLHTAADSTYGSVPVQCSIQYSAAERTHEFDLWYVHVNADVRTDGRQVLQSQLEPQVLLYY